MTTLADLNASGREQFVAAVGFAFEDSPWIAERAWESRPFDSVMALHSRMVGVIGSVRKDEVVDRAATPFKPGQNAATGWFKDFELNWPTRLLLDDDRA